MHYDIFISYAREDNRPIPETSGKGWVTALRDHIAEDHRRFSTEPLRLFMDTEEIRSMDDWQHRILGALRQSRILLVCLSPNYFASRYCRWEWEEYLRRQARLKMGTDTVAPVYFVEVPGSHERENAEWVEEVTRVNYLDLRPWFPEGPKALQREEVKARLDALGVSLWERLQRARRAEAAPGNLRRQNPHFVGRVEELRQLHEQLAAGAIGVVTALHGLGGQGKTELAVTYAHAFAHCYPGGLWSLLAEGRRELLPLVGELAFEPRLGLAVTEEQKSDPVLLGRVVLEHLRRLAESASGEDPDSGAAVLLVLDNVTEPELLSLSQLSTLPSGSGAGWLRIIATTRLDVRPVKDRLALIAVDALDEESALALIRDHQPPRDARGRIVADLSEGVPAFESAEEEQAAREIVRELGGFTLAVEQVAVFLGLHLEVAPSRFLEELRRRGLPSADALGGDPDVASQMLAQSKQLGLILDATLQRLEPAGLTALRFASLLPPDTVPWPWLRELTLEGHPELGDGGAFGVDPFQSLRRRLEGLRLLTAGDDLELARLHRLVGAHLKEGVTEADRQAVDRLLSDRADALYRQGGPPESWELDALGAALLVRLEGPDSAGLAVDAVILTEVLSRYRPLSVAGALLDVAHRLLAERASSDPGNAVWQRDLSVSHERLGGVRVAQGDLGGALESYGRALAIRERLAESDPGNAEWQRDLWISCWRMADVLEQLRDPESQHWWRRAYEVLKGMKDRGMYLSPADLEALDWLREKCAG